MLYQVELGLYVGIHIAEYHREYRPESHYCREISLIGDEKVVIEAPDR